MPKRTKALASKNTWTLVVAVGVLYWLLKPSETSATTPPTSDEVSGGDN